MIIRQATRADLIWMSALMAASPLLERYRVTLQSARRSLSAALDAGDALLAADEQRGFAWLILAPRVLGGAAYLRLLLVAEPGHGIGAQLLSAAERAASDQVDHVYLLATTDNAPARRFYEHHGYRHVGDLPGLVLPDLDEALYHKPLTIKQRPANG